MEAVIRALSELLDALRARVAELEAELAGWRGGKTDYCEQLRRERNDQWDKRKAAEARGDALRRERDAALATLERVREALAAHYDGGGPAIDTLRRIHAILTPPRVSDLHDYPRPIVCTCGHHFGHHDATDPCYRCTRCDCGVYFTDWLRAEELGLVSPPPVGTHRR